jgi:hypothetical protein
MALCCEHSRERVCAFAGVQFIIFSEVVHLYIICVTRLKQGLLGFNYTNWRGEYQQAEYEIVWFHVFVTEYIMSAVGEKFQFEFVA